VQGSLVPSCDCGDFLSSSVKDGAFSDKLLKEEPGSMEIFITNNKKQTKEISYLHLKQLTSADGAVLLGCDDV
jgi:hypothetical protein